MQTYTAIIEKCKDTSLFVGYIPGMPGAHSQGESLEELDENLKEVLQLILESGNVEPESEFVGTHTITV